MSAFEAVPPLWAGGAPRMTRCGHTPGTGLQTSGPQLCDPGASFDHLVGGGKLRFRHSEADRIVFT
jgi:hypothetical protein